MSNLNTLQTASKLGDLLALLSINGADQWKEIEDTAQSLANDLRSRDVEMQSKLGNTLLPQTLTLLLKGATQGSVRELDEGRKAALYEILRVAANLTNDHGNTTLQRSMTDENRGALLDAGFPRAVISLLEEYAEPVKPTNTEPLPLSIPDLRLVKTAVGVLLNLSIGYEPVQNLLISLEAATTILKLTTAIYPPGSWLREQHIPKDDLQDAETALVLESWSLRSGLAAWTLRLISELRDGAEEEDVPPQSPPKQVLSVDALPYVIRPLLAFIPPYPDPPPLFANPSSRKNLVQTDFNILGELIAILESLVLDFQDIRASLARGYKFPDEHGGVPCLDYILKFIQEGDYSPLWATEGKSQQDGRSKNQKAFANYKAAMIKSVVEIAGDEENMDVLWHEDTDEKAHGGRFVQTMVRFIKEHKNLNESDRDDLVICATISLGNLARKEAVSSALLRPPFSLGPDLADLLKPETDIKIKHGAIGLLKHLAMNPVNRPLLGELSIIQKLVASEVWSDKVVILDVVQVSAISVAKHMCAGNVENAYSLIFPDESSPSSPTALDQILGLVKRSDTVAIKSEGTRVLVNAIKAVFSHPPPSSSTSTSDPSSSSTTSDTPSKRAKAKDILLTADKAFALAQLIGRSKKYPMLIHEGSFSLFLLSSHNPPTGGQIVLDAIMNPLPAEVRPHPASRQNSMLNQPLSAGGPLAFGGAANDGAVDSPIVGAGGGPQRALDMIVYVLKTPAVPAEIRSNLITLVGHLGRKGVVPESRARDLEILKENTREIIEAAAKEVGPLGAAAKPALEAWNA
ncbi:hypothetical protein K474DRAFT_1585274 [Panus rudis PR-1116 ss-1]|nr:hypothetical protein K474DRAFT_1585274 [Panus rudis PR-1116 ss-1]